MKKEFTIEAKQIDMDLIKSFVNPLTKPDLPSYLQFLFAARGPLPYIEPVAVDKCRKLDPFFNSKLNPLELFKKYPNKPEAIKEEVKVITKFDNLIYKFKQHINNKKEEFKNWRNYINELISLKNNGNDIIEEEKRDILNKFSNNPYNTLVLYNLHFDVTEEIIIENFSNIGKIVFCRIIRDLNNKSRGYGFLEFEAREDAVYCYKNLNGKPILNRKVYLDIERGRVCNEFRPMRLGGGLNESRREKVIKKKIKIKKKVEVSESEDFDEPKRKRNFQRNNNNNNRSFNNRNRYNRDDRNNDRYYNNYRNNNNYDNNDNNYRGYRKPVRNYDNKYDNDRNYNRNRNDYSNKYSNNRHYDDSNKYHDDRRNYKRNSHYKEKDYHRRYPKFQESRYNRRRSYSNSFSRSPY